MSDYYSSPYENGVSQAQIDTYNANLAANVALYGGGLTWVPVSGDFQGNGVNDTWMKCESIWDTFFGGSISVQEVSSYLARSTEGGQEFCLALVNGANAHFSDWYDPMHIVPDSHSDAGGMVHDVMGGTAIAELQSNLKYVLNHVEALSQELFGNDFGSTNVFYDALAIPFIGIGDTVLDLYDGLSNFASYAWGNAVSFTGGMFSTLGDMWGGFMSEAGGFFGGLASSIGNFFSGASSSWGGYYDDYINGC
jgi:hypothetical protein